MLGGMIEQFGLDDDFEGPVTIINWTKTRRQRIVNAQLYDSIDYDIYAPEFSSD